MSKIKDFFKNFGTNAKADPMGTIKGLTQIAAGAGLVYGMATGVVPVNATTISVTGAALTSGVHAVGTDSSGNTAPVAQAVTNVINAATANAPATIDAVKAAKK